MSWSDERKTGRIPIPAELRWQGVRVRAVPVVVFGAVVLAFTSMWSTYVALPEVAGRGESELAESLQAGGSRTNQSARTGRPSELGALAGNAQNDGAGYYHPNPADAGESGLAPISQPLPVPQSCE